ncbi:hypothetical protein DAEQUDRAFT_779553 [Daedalea quercina L-15889]|uniref:Uncharacterized protein n=1 Tax=Daedalea quercina L-15889 TaxID=1314783 RepID=A0A165RVT9_9APHY|nr:hypothetical protein DAEQUDRAFT_779553 [Daedalea quercina L-15889]
MAHPPTESQTTFTDNAVPGLAPFLRGPQVDWPYPTVVNQVQVTEQVQVAVQHSPVVYTQGQCHYPVAPWQPYQPVPVPPFSGQATLRYILPAPPPARYPYDAPAPNQGHPNHHIATAPISAGGRDSHELRHHLADLKELPSRRRKSNEAAGSHGPQISPHEPLFIPGKSEVPVLDFPFPCRIEGCMKLLVPSRVDVEDHLLTAHGIQKPQICPWPEYLCKGRGKEVMKVRSVFRHIIETHGWQYTWRCPWCLEDYAIGTRMLVAARQASAQREASHGGTDYEVSASEVPATSHQSTTAAEGVIRDLKELMEQRPELAPDLLQQCASVFRCLGEPQH